MGVAQKCLISSEPVSAHVPACNIGWSCQPETGDHSEFAFILKTSVSRAWGGEGRRVATHAQLSEMWERRGLQLCPARGTGSGRWDGPAWLRNSGTEGSLGTRPALTACPSTLPASCQHQLGVGSVPWAWEKGQRPVPARDPVRQKHSDDLSTTECCPVVPFSQPGKLFQPRKTGLRGA